MELKVMFDGVQKIISGVTPETTCKDIVFCLAQANKQFGKFILIERRRKQERLLSPDEHPIELVSKLGDYASDVQFIMRRSESSLTATNTSSKEHRSPSKLFSPIAAERLNGSNSNLRSPKQSMSNSSNSNQVITTDDEDHHHHHQLKQATAKLSPSSMVQTSQTQTALNKSHCNNDSNYLNASPTAQLQARPKHPPSYIEALAKSTLLSSNTPPLTKTSQQQTSTPINHHHQTYPHLPPSTNNQEQYNHHHHFNGGFSNCKSPDNNGNNNGAYSPCSELDWNKQLTNRNSPVNLINNMINNNDNNNKSNKLLLNQQQQMATVDDRQRDAFKLITLQKDTMKTQRQELIDLDAELSYWDSKLQLEDEKLIEVEENIRHYQRLWQEQEAQLSKLESQQMLFDEVKLANKMLENEKGELKVRINHNDCLIADSRKSIQTLLTQLEALEELRDEEARKEKDDFECQLMLEVKQEIAMKIKESETLNEELCCLRKEVAKIDEIIAERTKDCEQLHEKLKEANLQGLNLIAKDDLIKQKNVYRRSNSTVETEDVLLNSDKENNENCDLNMCDKQIVSSDRFLYRPGSTRRMYGSPRQLENAVATNKNPHGVWV